MTSWTRGAKSVSLAIISILIAITACPQDTNSNSETATTIQLLSGTNIWNNFIRNVDNSNTWNAAAKEIADTDRWKEFVNEVQESRPEIVKRNALIVYEASQFFTHLVIEHKLPSLPTNSHGQTIFNPVPQRGTEPFLLTYPIAVQVRLAITNGTLGGQIYRLEKADETGGWAVVSGWLYDANSNAVDTAQLPTTTAQGKANHDISRNFEKHNE